MTPNRSPEQKIFRAGFIGAGFQGRVYGVKTFRLFREPYIPSLNLFQHQVSLMTVNGGRFIDYIEAQILEEAHS
jgi:hypothetical protein